ncbi:MAG: glycoside hydrolase family 127 protein [Clostridia bacterium]|nr:glycoside hydrolase family 127 protein [Clostridia bacterium]
MHKYAFYTPAELKPAGWMRRQLEIQADGLSGALDLVWRDVRDSAWIGGEAEGWERVPYWLDGFIPLAYLLDDEDKKKRAKKYIDAILDRQCADGWICPCTEEERAEYDIWAVFLISKVLLVWYDCSGDARALDAVYRALKNTYELLLEDKVTIKTWGKFRTFEAMIAIERLYEINAEEWLLALTRILRERGADYTQLTEDWKRPINHWRLETHIVNIVMALKSEAVRYRLLGEEYTDEAETLWQVLEKYNGTSVGTFTGDECLSGISPIQGTELCSVVELMYSAETLFSRTGDVKWADRLERAAFNALPATITEDMWAHQYDQMSNQIETVPFPGKSLFRTNGPGSHIFGLEPHFGCCTANFNQGWPKLALSAFMHTEDTIVNVTPIPAILDCEMSGVGVKITTDTLYPFRNSVRYNVSADAPVSFKLKLRVPSWSKSAKIDGAEACVCDDFVTLEREWCGTESFTLEFEREVELCTLANELYFVKYGPLTFSLPIEGKWYPVEYERKGVERKQPYCDWHVYRRGEYAYGFDSSSFTVRECEGDGKPFSHSAPLLEIDARLCPINWEMADGYRNVPAANPADRRAIGEAEVHTLVPYGCTSLRMTELPFVEKQPL